jgi:hypothetical protein
MEEVHSDQVGMSDSEFEELLALGEQFRNGNRIVLTARGFDQVNLAIRKGYAVAVVMPVLNPEFKTYVRVVTNAETGELEPGPTGFSAFGPEELYYTVRTVPLPSIINAYLVHPTLAFNETVWLDDLIEEYVGIRSHKGVTRLKSHVATWNGKSFDIPFERFANGIRFVSYH